MTACSSTVNGETSPTCPFCKCDKKIQQLYESPVVKYATLECGHMTKCTIITNQNQIMWAWIIDPEKLKLSQYKKDLVVVCDSNEFS